MSQISFDHIQKFHLRAPKGKIIKQSVYSAYTKTKCSSIPSKVEVIILKSPDELKLTKDLNSNTHTKSMKDIKDDNDNNLPHLLKSQSNPQFSSFFQSETNRFDNQLEFREKYAPGPGEYHSDKILKNFDTSLRYKSLFKNTNQNFSISKEPYKMPGPGSYDPIYFDNVKSVNFNSQGERFKDFPKPKKDEELSVEMQILLEKIKKNKLKTKKRMSDVSSFFKRNLNVLPQHIKNKKLLEKYIVIPEKLYQHNETPAPGQYNFKSDFTINVEEYNKMNQDKIFIPEDIRKGYNFIKNSNEPEEKKETFENKMNKIIKMNMNDLQKENLEYFKGNTKEIRSPFISKTKQGEYCRENLDRHVPGPCYYQNNIDKRTILGTILEKKKGYKKKHI